MSSNLILIALSLLSVGLGCLITYGVIRLRRLERRVDAHEEAERLVNLPEPVQRHQRRHLRALPVIAALAGVGALIRSRPWISAASAAVGAAAVVTVIAVTPPFTGDTAAAGPSGSAPASTTYSRPSATSTTTSPSASSSATSTGRTAATASTITPMPSSRAAHTKPQDSVSPTLPALLPTASSPLPTVPTLPGTPSGSASARMELESPAGHRSCLIDLRPVIEGCLR